MLLNIFVALGTREAQEHPDEPLDFMPVTDLNCKYTDLAERGDNRLNRLLHSLLPFGNGMAASMPTFLLSSILPAARESAALCSNQAIDSSTASSVFLLNNVVQQPFADLVSV